MMNSGSYYDFGERGAKRRDRVAEALMGQGMSTEPVGHWTQAVARALQGTLGGHIAGQDRKMEQAQEKAFQDAVGGLFQPDPVSTALAGPQPSGGGERSDGMKVIRTAGGTPFTVAAQYAPRFEGLLNDLEAGGYAIDPNQSGGFNKRNIAGTNTPSQHSFGRAVDINWNDNPRGGQGKIDPVVARELAQKYGMKWGGDWKNPDPMHFEVIRDNVPMAERGMTSAAGLTPPAAPPTAQSQPQQAVAGLQVDDRTKQYLGALMKDPRYREAGMQLINSLLKKQMGADGAEAPSTVREWEYFNKLSPEDQQRFLTMKRAEKYLDTGTGFVRPDPVTGQVAPVVNKNLAKAESQKAQGKAEGEGIASAPSEVAKAEAMLKTIQDIRNHPRRQAGTGTSAYLPSWRAQTRDFDNLVDQAKGQAFLQAFESLKGGGQITEIEGQKATQALARLQQTGSEEGFLQALTDLEEVVTAGLERARARAGQADHNGGPQAGVIEDGYRFKGGNPSDPNNWEKVQ